MFIFFSFLVTWCLSLNGLLGFKIYCWNQSHQLLHLQRVRATVRRKVLPKASLIEAYVVTQTPVKGVANNEKAAAVSVDMPYSTDKKAAGASVQTSGNVDKKITGTKFETSDLTADALAGAQMSHKVKHWGQKHQHSNQNNWLFL